ncbi:MAG TPA: hypothetical protein VMH61_01120 [Candidatus Acidoferrales bacterium]|nr:hypothetical protein [Candidatus Acidoferrales bacterium]
MPLGMRRALLVAAVALAVFAGRANRAGAATFHGQSVDGRWYDGKAVSTTFGAFRCQLKFTDDRVYIRPAEIGITIVGVLDDEVILDPHDIVAHDPKRGIDWSIDCFNLPS